MEIFQISSECSSPTSKSRYTDAMQGSTTNPVFIYRNLTKGCWSIKDTKTNRVVGHADSIRLVNCRFKVSEAGRQRVIRERKKYVHAGVVGMLTSENSTIDSWSPVRYNPYMTATFVDLSGNAVHTASAVLLDNNGKVYMEV